MLTLVSFNQQEHSRLGFVVAKKNIRRAVDRNRAKRHIRESFRLYQVGLKSLDVVILVRRGFGELSNYEMNQLLYKQWSKLCQRVEDKKHPRRIL